MASDVTYFTLRRRDADKELRHPLARQRLFMPVVEAGAPYPDAADQILDAEFSLPGVGIQAESSPATCSWRPSMKIVRRHQGAGWAAAEAIRDELAVGGVPLQQDASSNGRNAGLGAVHMIR